MNHHQLVARVLNNLAPAQTFIHVGAGEGTGPLAFWHEWPLQSAFVIDAQEDRLQQWQPSENVESFRRISAVLSGEDGEVQFHLASNPDHSGLVEAESFRRLWPNLRNLESITQKALLLDSLTHDIPIENLWLIIECFSAVDVLNGGHKTLTYTQVAFVRVLLSAPEDSTLHNSSIGSVDQLMLKKGFIRVETILGAHPGIADAVYVRNLKDELVQTDQALHSSHSEIARIEEDRAKLTRDRDSQTQHAKERQAQVEALTKAKEEQTRIAAEQQSQIEALKPQMAQLQTQYDKLQAERKKTEEERAKLKQDRDSQALLAKERQAQVEALTKAKEEQTRIATEQQSQIEALKPQMAQLQMQYDKLQAERQKTEEERAKLKQDRDSQALLAKERQAQVEALTKAKEEQILIAAEQQSRIEALEREIEEQETRREAIHEEMIRAEAQIELIKDVLLREPGV